MTQHKIYSMSFAKVYPLYIHKAERKQRTKEEVDQLIFWLTGYDQKSLALQLEREADVATFFEEAPRLNPARKQLKGKVCGVQIEWIKEPLMQEIRYLDKLIDDLAKGKAIEKICPELE